MALNQAVMKAVRPAYVRQAGGVDYLYSLYDALDMGTTLATKQDLEMLRRDMNHRFALVDQQFSTFELRIVVKLGSMMVVGFGLMLAAMRLWG